MRGIAVRQDLTDEWKNRGARTSKEYAILTNEIMQGAFDLKVDDYKQVKGLARENLRDHMTDIAEISGDIRNIWGHNTDYSAEISGDIKKYLGEISGDMEKYLGT